MTDNIFTEDVAKELDRARQLHANINSLHEGYAIILEELEEFKAEVFLKDGARVTERLWKELVQVSAMCQRTAEDVLHSEQQIREFLDEMESEMEKEDV